ncbi:MAG: hypothetical protein DMG81_18865, partial [Acidobacteria bacterium]
MSFLVEVDMRPESAKTLLHVVCLAFVICISAGAQCPVQAVLIKGRVENATVDSKVRVQLLYPKGKRGESGEVTVEDGAFQIPIEFVTEKSSQFTNLPRRCSRRPKTVVITLMQGDQESRVRAILALYV